jgi:hypothetical protein
LAKQRGFVIDVSCLPIRHSRNIRHNARYRTHDFADAGSQRCGFFFVGCHLLYLFWGSHFLRGGAFGFFSSGFSFCYKRGIPPVRIPRSAAIGKPNSAATLKTNSAAVSVRAASAKVHAISMSVWAGVGLATTGERDQAAIRKLHLGVQSANALVFGQRCGLHCSERLLINGRLRRAWLLSLRSSAHLFAHIALVERQGEHVRILLVHLSKTLEILVTHHPKTGCDLIRVDHF